MLMKTMNAWVVTAPGSLELLQVPVPVPKDNEILIKTSYTCLCNGSDPGIFYGHEAYTPPFIFGHEASGIIVEAGKDVVSWKPGDFVFCWCASGAFAEYQIICPDAVALFPVPQGISRDASPVMELVMASCRALMGRPATEGKRTLLICGLGPSGLILTQYARMLGYEHIAGWDLYENRRKLALELGIDEVFDPTDLDENNIEHVGQYDVSVDMFGDDLLAGEPVFSLMLRATAIGGTVISYGHPRHGRHFSPYVFQKRRLTMLSPEGDLNRIREEGQLVLDAVEKGLIRVEPLVTHRKTVDDIGDAFRHLLEDAQDQIKVVFRMEKEA